MINELHIKTVVLSQVLDKSITSMNKKYCNILSSKIMHTQIVCDLLNSSRFLNTAHRLMEFTVNAMRLHA
jgi:hypothetical protein